MSIISGSLGMAVVVGIFVLIVVVLVVLLLVGRFRTARHDALPPEHVPYPGGQSIPPTGSR